MKTVLITGSTRGIGYGLANSFLNHNCQVIISGRSKERIEKAINSLSQKHDPEFIFGYPCDAADYSQIESLWRAAFEHFGKIDIWINNAGISHTQSNFWEIPPDKIQQVINTNLTGAIYGTKVAVQGMLEQGFGAIYNMEGLGSDGRQVSGLSIYSTTKSGLRYFNKTLINETKNTPVIVGMLSPGMVITDLLLRDQTRSSEDLERAKRIFNILADKVKTVTPWLAQQVLNNTRHGADIQWLTTPKILWRFLSAPFHKRDLFNES